MCSQHLTVKLPVCRVPILGIMLTFSVQVET